MNQRISSFKAITVLILVSLGIYTGCKKKENSLDDIQVNNSQISQFAFIDPLVDSAYIIALKTTENSLIPDWPDQVLLTNDDKIVLIHTGLESMLSIFDARTGAFINQIKSTGEGPGEFSSFKIATYNPFENSIELFADFQRKEIAYNTKGEFLQEKQQSLLYSTKTYITPEICAYNFNQPNAPFFDPNESYQLAIHHQNTNTWITAHPIPKSLEEKISLYNPYTFSVSSGEILWNKPFSNQIYTITEKDAILRNTIQFNQKNLNAEIIQTSSRYDGMVNMFEDLGIPFLPAYYLETSNTIFFPYNNQKNLIFCAVDKAKNRVVFNAPFLVFKEWDITLPFPLNASQNTLIIPLAASLFAELMQNHPNPSLLPKSFHDIHKTLKANDNPVLMMIKLK